MKKTKIRERFENAFEAFFDNEKLAKYSSASKLDYLAEDCKETESFAVKHQTFLKILRQTLFFLPGTFLVFYISLGTILFGLPHGGGASRLVMIYSIGIAAAVMTWFGLGNIKNTKHLAIPFSVILTAVVIGIISVATAGFLPLYEKLKTFDYAIMLFPIALIVPILTKGWIDRKSENL